MISLNLTLLVQLLLFLIFMWGMHRLILAPTLATLDRRNELLLHNEEEIAKDLTTAMDLESRYREEMANMYRTGEERIRQARHEAAIGRYDRLAAESREAAAAVAIVRREAAESIEAQRAAAAEVVHGLTQSMAEILFHSGSDRK